MCRSVRNHILLCESGNVSSNPYQNTRKHIWTCVFGLHGNVDKSQHYNASQRTCHMRYVARKTPDPFNRLQVYDCTRIFPWQCEYKNCSRHGTWPHMTRYVVSTLLTPWYTHVHVNRDMFPWRLCPRDNLCSKNMKQIALHSDKNTPYHHISKTSQEIARTACD